MSISENSPENASDKIIVDAATKDSQARASDPQNSAWVSANAGSGKTYVLTQRVVRLLLAGFDPSRILCLTFTKSAAAEMSNRVFEILSNWAVMDEKELFTTLTEITGSSPDKNQINEARRLFARALETPGGLKIQTIHAFCEALLHQFPLEANIAGHFEIMDERAQFDLINEARRLVITAAFSNKDGAFGRSLAQLIDITSDFKIDAAIGECIKKRQSLNRWLKQVGGVTPAISDLRAHWEFADGETVETIVESFLGQLKISPLELIEIAEAADATGVATNQRFAASMRKLQAAKSAQQRYDLMEQIFLTKSGDLRKPGGLYTSKLTKLIPDKIEPVLLELDNFDQLRQRRNLLMQLDASEALFTIAEAIIRLFDKTKRARGLLDFDDLIVLSANLLARSDASQWVQFKLDQGIDHVLVDEAQDTNPQQWRVIITLIEEFFSGKGAREANRTIFAVGDEKQSIYSFQGAVPTAFADQRDRLKKLAARAEKQFEDINLRLSFRSVPDVLSAVDKVFSAPENYSGLGRDSEKTIHDTVRHQDPGVVEIWPLIKKVSQEEPEDWEMPVDQLTNDDPQILLANKIADRVQSWLENETVLEGKGRSINAGDILILVRSRDRFASAVTRELKQRNIAVAGSDRLRLTDHIAVLDLIALAKFILLPQDDLSLAAVLKSPLFGFDEDLLLALAHGRGNSSLFNALIILAQTNEIASTALNSIETLRRRATEFRVYEFYAMLLGADGGRQKIINRIGQEAEDVLDAFLAQILAHEQSGLPGLESFIDWLELSSPEVKREFDLKENTIKIMTVHAAKGLEAPIVFLVDKGAPPYHGRHDPALVEIDELIDSSEDLTRYLWVPDKKTAAPSTLRSLEKNKEQAEAEYQRLLYVAMTRAEDRLIICGTTGTKDANERCWHKIVMRALLEDCSEHLDDNGEIAYYRWQKTKILIDTKKVDEKERQSSTRASLPSWIDVPAKSEPQLPKPLTPSGAQAMIDAQDWGNSARSPLSRQKVKPSFALQRGIAIHRLLQVLPDLGADNGDLEIENQSPQLRREAASRYLQASLPNWSNADIEQIHSEVFSILDNPDHGVLFTAGKSSAEVAVSGTVELGGVSRFISGQIDRLVIDDHQITIVDYKTNRSPPNDVAGIPSAYISQLALYQLLVCRIYPDHQVKSAILWSEAPKLMFVPQNLLDEQLVPLHSTN